MELHDAITQFRLILTAKLSGKQDRTEFIEIIMILLVGFLWGLYNPHQVAEHLGVSSSALYSALKSLSAHHWRSLLDQLMLELALEKLRRYEEASPATRSRMEATLTIDDSVVKRFGAAISYVWCWYSGQSKQVVRGQDLVGIVLKIEGEIIPLRLVWVTKQGRGATSKPEVLGREMAKLVAYFAEEKIDLTNVGVSLDSWWVGEELSKQLAELGFKKQVFAAKSNHVLKVGKEEKKLREWQKEAQVKEGWGQPRDGGRMAGENPTFGKVAVIFFYHPRSKTFGVLCPEQQLRCCEALRIWENHPAVETFWKRMKSWVGLGKQQWRGSAGAWGELCLRVLAYFFGASLFSEGRETRARLTIWLRRKATFAQLIEEHFQEVVC